MKNEVDIVCKINDELIIAKGYLRNNIIKFQDNNKKNIIFDKKSLKLVKKDVFIIDFNKKICSIDNVSFSILINLIQILDNEININYEIGKQKFKFSLKYK